MTRDMSPTPAFLRLDPAAMRAEGDRIAAEQRERSRLADVEEYAYTVWMFFNTEPVVDLSLEDHVAMVLESRECNWAEAMTACLEARRDV